METIEQVEVEETPSFKDCVFYAVTAQTPWWIVSCLLHVLVISLAGLASMNINLETDSELIITTSEFIEKKAFIEVKNEKDKDKINILNRDKNSTKTDDETKDVTGIEIPKDILDKAEISDHFETVNPDRPDTQSAFGVENATMFYSSKGIVDEVGGGGQGGVGFDDIIGVGGLASAGSGNGWGGGNGNGTGNQDGNGHGSFGSRIGGGRVLRVKKSGGSSKTEHAVDIALRWLAYHQESDGHWNAKKYGADVKTDTAITGFALLAFLGAGHTETTGEYRGNVQRAVAWLISKQDADGMVWDTSDEGAHRAKGYPNAIATMALAEAAGMANVPGTKAAAQKAITYATEKHQAGDGYEKGGWRYNPKQPGDTSVTGWYIMAMKSAKIAGLKINPLAWDGAFKFLDSVEKKSDYASVYWYTPTEAHESSQHRLTAIGCLARQFLGHKKEELQASVEGFVKKGGLPKWGDNTDLYYSYYGTLCVFQQGGDIWNNWNNAMKEAYIPAQRKDGDETGSWDPLGAYSSEWGRVGQTALVCLALEVYYRYDKVTK